MPKIVTPSIPEKTAVPSEFEVVADTRDAAKGDYSSLAKLDLPEAASTSAKGGGRFPATGSGAIRRD